MGLPRNSVEWNFVDELLFLSDVLEVLWSLSAYMQTRSASLLDAQPKIKVAIKTLQMLKEQPGINLSTLIKSGKCLSTFQDITLTTDSNDYAV